MVIPKQCIPPNNYIYGNFIGSSVIAMFAYLLSNVFFAIVDLTGRPQWVQQYKIQEDHTVPVSQR